MPLIKDDHVVETLTSNGADHPFDEWILPRGARCGKDLLYPETVDENPTETKALQVPEPPPIRPEEPTGEGDVGERVATLGHSFASESMMHHYHLSTHHVFQMPRSDVRSETLAALQSIIEVATGGPSGAVTRIPEYFLSIRNTWVGAVGWLIQDPSTGSWFSA